MKFHLSPLSQSYRSFASPFHRQPLTRQRSGKALLTIAAMAATGLGSASAGVSLTGFGSYTENFDSLEASGTTFGTTGWEGYNSNTAITTLVADNGSSTSGGLHNYGTTSATDRALGSVGSGSSTPRFGVVFTNTTGLDITDVAISFTNEQWRAGSSSAANEVNPFKYKVGATNVSDTQFSGSTAVTSLDVAEIQTGTTSAAALDGNAAGNKSAKTGSITGLTVGASGTLAIRWEDSDTSGTDAGVAVDDFTMTITKASTNGTDRAITSIVGASTLTIQNGSASVASTLTANVSTTQVFAGVLQNGGAAALALTKSGNGTVTLSGTNTYTGATTISGGTLALSGTGTLGSGAVSVGTGSVLDISARGANYSLSAAVTGTGTITTGSRTLTLNGAFSPATASTAGAITVDGKLTLGGTSTTTINILASAFDSINVLAGGTFTYGGSIVLNFDSGWTLADGTYELVTGAGSLAGSLAGISFGGKYAGEDAFTESGGIWTGTTSDGGTFSFDPSAGVLSITSIPEPGQHAAAVGALLVAVVAMRRRHSLRNS